MTLLGSARWYVVQTQPHAETKAATHLCRQGFGAYVPRYLKRRRHARRSETIAAPLFPRYLFVTIDVEVQRWRAIQSTVGVSRLVCSGDNPAAVPDGIVEALKRREDDRGFVTLEDRPLAPGDKIRVLDGVFADCLGLFVGMTDQERVAVLLDLLGRQVRVVIDSGLVTAA
ncbi:MAG TPA: transcriptional activator RfaH [Alphaproteobacteria bacterium]